MNIRLTQWSIFFPLDKTVMEVPKNKTHLMTDAYEEVDGERVRKLTAAQRRDREISSESESSSSKESESEEFEGQWSKNMVVNSDMGIARERPATAATTGFVMATASCPHRIWVGSCTGVDLR